MRISGLVLILLGVSSVSTTSVSQNANVSLDTANLNLAELKDGIGLSLRDPNSARVIAAIPRTVPNAAGVPTSVVCGKMNARNGYGGMSPAVRFVYLVETKETMFQQEVGIGLTNDTIGVGAVVYGNFCPANL
ncbi:hypothetical protein ABIF96_006520 [Bradyrhizobium ottawaense]|uniref:hypothetical protein n=1 Tax=Bradyrhizobium ottawaense TaxID=931866 RepID=UPI001BA8C2EC|nr:hypothetical protein [Bradyrhizobium ottawaense]MBR1362808.1 hypothetical protein [Bradyrhizobium ottawaense]